MHKTVNLFGVRGALFLCLVASPAFAGVFDIPNFLEGNQFSIGAEPEVVLNNDAGFGFNAKYKTAFSDLTNLEFGIGTGGGSRNFRTGGAVIFDIYPNTEKQVGIGFAPQLYYVRRAGIGQLEVTLIPYIHETFDNEDQSVHPFFAIPFGVNFYSGTYKGFTAISIGSLFKYSEHLKFVAELGVSISNADTTISGGLVYTP